MRGISHSSFSQIGSMKLKIHIATIHEGQNPFKFSFCDDSLTQIGSILQQFMRGKKHITLKRA
jgi:hypothetical protein